MKRAMTAARVALADDVPGVRVAMARMLERLGHTVVCEAANGVELIDQCSGQQVDVVFTDLDMPIMDGLAAAEELAVQGIPVILVTGHPDADKIVIQHEPVIECLTKPVASKSLEIAIVQALAKTKERQSRLRNSLGK